MENILYLNAVLPYIYLISFFVCSKVSNDLGPLYLPYGTAMLIQIVGTLIISLNSHDKKKLADVNLKVKLIQIPYYIAFFIFAVLSFMVLMGLMGIGIFFLPIFIAIDAVIFATTVIPAEICAIKLKRLNKISFGRLLLYLIFNTWYVIDIFIAFMIKKDFKTPEQFPLTEGNITSQIG